MYDISPEDKFKILVAGSLSTILIFFLIFAFFTDFIASFVVSESMADQVIFTIIFFGLEFIALVISIIVSFIIIDDISVKVIVKASILSFIAALFIVVFISYVVLFLFFPFVFEDVYGIEIVLVWTQVFIYTGIYVFGSPIDIFIASILLYYLIFIILIEDLFEYRKEVYKT